MVNVDAREKDVKAAEAELKAETAEIEKKRKSPQGHRRRSEAALRVERQAGRPAPRHLRRILRHYERVIKFRGSGLAEVRDHKCMGCQVMLRPQTYNEVRNGEKVMVCESCSRIYYFNPANEVKPEVEVVTVTGRKRARPKADAPQAWFYRPDYPEEGEVLLAFINADGKATRRIYELHTGRQFGEVLQREGTYRQAFPEDLTDSALRLNGHWDEEEIDEWGAEIPSNVLDLLHKDLLAIRREHKASPKHADSHTSSRPPTEFRVLSPAVCKILKSLFRGVRVRVPQHVRQILAPDNSRRVIGQSLGIDGRQIRKNTSFQNRISGIGFHHPPAAIRIDSAKQIGPADLRAVARSRVAIATAIRDLGIISQRRHRGLFAIHSREQHVDAGPVLLGVNGKTGGFRPGETSSALSSLVL